MSVILIVVAVEIVLLMVYGVVRTVLNERHRQRIQHEQAAAYFATQEARYAWIEPAARDAVLSNRHQRTR